MMNLKTFSKLICLMIVGFLTAQHAQAQTTYKTGVGLMIDVGDGGTLVGPHVKHFFDNNQAGKPLYNSEPD